MALSIVTTTHIAGEGPPPTTVGLRELPGPYKSLRHSMHSRLYEDGELPIEWPNGWNENGDVRAAGIARYTTVDCCGLKELVFTDAMCGAGPLLSFAEYPNLDCETWQPPYMDLTMPARIWLALLLERRGVLGTIQTAAVRYGQSGYSPELAEVLGNKRWYNGYMAYAKRCAAEGIHPCAVRNNPVAQRIRNEVRRRLFMSGETFSLMLVMEFAKWHGLGRITPLPAYQNKNSSNIILPLFFHPDECRDDNKTLAWETVRQLFAQVMPVVREAHTSALGRVQMSRLTNRYDRHLRKRFTTGAVVDVPDSIISPWARQFVGLLPKQTFKWENYGIRVTPELRLSDYTYNREEVAA